MELSDDQAAAEERFQRFLDADATTFGLFGYAGTGKSFTLAYLMKNYILGGSVLLASPTHKAAHVMRRFLSKADVPFQNGLEKGLRNPCVGTTAQLLGILPMVSDDQDDTKLAFSKGAKGLIERATDLDWIIVDEVSMLSGPQFAMVRDMAASRGARVLVVGDPGQLPPVNDNPIPFEKFVHKATLTQVQRTADDTGITALAQAVRVGEEWRRVRGSGIEHVADAAGAYLADLAEPFGCDEGEWSVYVAYRNIAVHAVNEAACQKVYGHGRYDIAPSEVVLANNSLFQYQAGAGNVPLCTNGEALTIISLGRRGRWGVNITVRSIATGLEFVAEYLPENERADPHHPFNVELSRLRAKAQQLQRDQTDEAARRRSWAEYFSHRDSTVLSVSHPFAMTSHKSQGSTYQRAFVDARDMAPFDARALYVGATRPSEELIIG